MRRVVLALALIVAAGLGSKAWAGVMRLSYANFFPPTHVQSRLAEAWCREVERLSGGRIKIDYFPGQSLVRAAQSYEAVASGICEIAMGCFAYTRGRFPVMEVVDLPLGYRNALEATKVANILMRELKPRELRDVKILYLHAHGPGMIHTRTRAVQRLEDLKGLKLRAHGTSALVAKALGAAVVSMPMPQVYQALARGVADGALYPLEANLGWRLMEVVRYVTLETSTGYTTCFFVAMNRRVWEGLPAKLRHKIEALDRRWAIKSARAWDEADTAGLKALLRLPGRKAVRLSQGERCRWQKAARKVWEEYMARASAKGIDGKRVLATALEILSRVRKENAQH